MSRAARGRRAHFRHQIDPQLPENGLPAVGGALSIKPNTGIPRTRRARDLPAPTRHRRQNGPSRHSQRTRHVNGSIADRNHQIERRELGGKLVQVDERIALGKVVDLHSEFLPGVLQLVDRVAILQVDPLNSRQVEQLPPLGECGRSLLALAGPAAGTPRNSDLQTGAEFGESLLPAAGAGRIGRKVFFAAGKISRFPPQVQRNAAGRNLPIDVLGNRQGHPIANASMAEHRGLRKRSLQKRLKPRIADEETALGLGDQLRVTRGKHHLVADALLGMDQQRLAGQGRSVPAGLRVAIEEHFAGLLTPLVLRPGALEIALQQVGVRKVPVCFRIVGVDAQRRLVGKSGRRQFSHRAINVSQVVMRLGTRRAKPNGPLSPGQSLVEAHLLLQNGTHVQSGFVKIGLSRNARW